MIEYIAGALALVAAGSIAFLATLRVVEKVRQLRNPQLRQQAQQAIEGVKRIEDVYVLEVSETTAVLHKCRPDMKDPHLLVSQAGKAFYVKDVKPLIMVRRGLTGVKGSLLYLWLDNRPLEIDPETGKPSVKEVNPEILGTLLETKIFKKISRALGGLDVTGVLVGVGLGGMLCFFIVFVVLPALGVPVMVGKGIEVVVNPVQQPPLPVGSQLPPPGNFTVGG